jgi:hypothetical protein
LAGIDFDQLAAVKDPDQAAVGTDLDPLADQPPRHRVQRSGHFNVMIPVYLGGGVVGHVIALGRWWSQAR